MAAQHEGAHILDRDAHVMGKEQAEARAVEHARHADDAVMRQAAGLAHHPDHDVERVGDGDDESVRAIGLDVLADGGDDLGVGADEIVAAHAGLAREAGGDDHDIGAGDDGVVVATGELGVEALDRRGLGDVERLPLRNAVDDIEEHDVAQLLEARQQSKRAADLPGADKRDLVACHHGTSFVLGVMPRS